MLTEKTDGVNETVVREQTGNRSLVLFDSGDEVTVQAGDEGVRFLLVSGRPIEEPVAWYGPIVMNTRGRTAAGFCRTAQRHVHHSGAHMEYRRVGTALRAFAHPTVFAFPPPAKRWGGSATIAQRCEPGWGAP